MKPLKVVLVVVAAISLFAIASLLLLGLIVVSAVG
jgi:hypothetical protein